MPTAAPSSPRRAIAWRIAVALFGGYVLTWGVVALGVAGLYALGLPFHDAEMLGFIVGLLVFLTVFLWTFAVRRLGRLAAMLLGGGAVMAAAASAVQRLLIA